MLHVTNGDSAADLLRASGVLAPDDAVLPWRDVLHDGPLPALQGDALRRVRAEFIAAAGWADDVDAVEADLAARDEQLAEHRTEPIVLWFEADLYDQLQILQIVAQLDALGRTEAAVEIVCIDRHPKLVRFSGLGELAPADFVELAARRRPLDARAWQLALDAWSCVRAPDPTALVRFAATIGADAWPFLGDALHRWLHEYPGIDDGLSLTQRRILEGIADGIDDPLRLFRRLGAQELRPYLGDTSFFATLTGLVDAEVALVEFVGGSRGAPPGRQTVALTHAGRAALAGTHDHVRASGIDRWLGGVHLTGAPDWRLRETGGSAGEIVVR